MIQNFPKGNDEIAEGSLFRRVIGGSMSEIAEVLEVGHDRLGIPHVRFNAHLVRGACAAQISEQRTLALDSFFARYKERIRINEKANRLEPYE